jgi:hypothetical protein
MHGRRFTALQKGGTAGLIVPSSGFAIENIVDLGDDTVNRGQH